MWALSADDFQTLASRQPGLRRSLGRNVRARLSRADQMQAVMRLSQMPIFAQLPPQAVQAMAQRMVLQHIPAGERVYRIGEVGDAMYLVESGEIELTAENAVGIVEEIGRIGSDGFFGELSLLTGQIRVEDATATRNTNLWILNKSDLDALSAQNPAVGKALSQGVATRLATAGASDEQALRQFALFADINPSELKQVAALLRPMRYRSGEIIFRTSAPADKLYLIDKGNVRVQALSGGAYLLGAGESFGERALITEQPHNTTASAESDVDVWTLNKSDLDMLMNRYPRHRHQHHAHHQPAHERGSRCTSRRAGARQPPASTHGERAVAATPAGGLRHGDRRTAPTAPGIRRMVRQHVWRCQAALHPPDDALCPVPLHHHSVHGHGDHERCRPGKQGRSGNTEQCAG